MSHRTSRLRWFAGGATAALLAVVFLNGSGLVSQEAGTRPAGVASPFAPPRQPSPDHRPPASGYPAGGARGEGVSPADPPARGANQYAPSLARRVSVPLSPARRVSVQPSPARRVSEDDGKLRIIAFGAHPDDCEIKVAGSAAKWAALGHHVKFVSVTNGDIGHWGQAGGPLAQRRTAEVEKCAKILGIETQVLDIHDGELLPTLENRKLITQVIRDWRADVVLSHRPNDYHPDHRNVGLLVQDAAYMVTVPFFCPDVPHLTKNPVFLYYEDRFTKPNRFTADIVVNIDDVIEKKLAAMEALESQFYEGGCNGGPQLVPDPKNAAGVAARKKEVRDQFAARFAATARRFAGPLAEWYGAETAGKIQHAEAFEICEYGRMPSRDEIKKLFPFLPD